MRKHMWNSVVCLCLPVFLLIIQTKPLKVNNYAQILVQCTCTCNNLLWLADSQDSFPLISNETITMYNVPYDYYNNGYYDIG